MEQRTEEWHKKRMPMITVSRFGDILANPKTKRYRYYMDDIIDGINGHQKIEKYTPWFDHGNEMEEEGIGYYEWVMQRDTHKVGFIVHPEHDFIGGSPDRLIGDDGGLELKCHVSYTQFRNIEKKGIPSQYIPQVQGYLWVTGRKWWDYTSYYRNGEKRLIAVFPVYPDLEYHKKLETACLDFWAKIQEKINGK